MSERERFEAWFARTYHPAALRPMESGCYLNRSAGMAWDAWQAALAAERQRIEREVMPLVGALCVDIAFKDAVAAAANVAAILRAIRGEQSAPRVADKLATPDESEMRTALELIAAPMRPDGTWNRDRAACRELAARVLELPT